MLSLKRSDAAHRHGRNNRGIEPHQIELAAGDQFGAVQAAAPGRAHTDGKWIRRSLATFTARQFYRQANRAGQHRRHIFIKSGENFGRDARSHQTRAHRFHAAVVVSHYTLSPSAKLMTTNYSESKL